MSKNRYCFDTNFLIDSVRTYPEDVFPSYWEKIENLKKEDKLFSIDLVKYELDKHDDYASNWARDHKDCFKEPDEKTIQEFQEIQRKYNRPDWIEKQADPSLLAFSKTRKLILLTSDKDLIEISEKEDVKCMGILEFCRTEGFSF